MIVGITAGGPDLLARVRDALAAGVDHALIREGTLPAGIEALAADYPGRIVLHARMPGARDAARTLPVGLHHAGEGAPAGWDAPPEATRHGVWSASTHSVGEARRAEAAGAGWVLLSPIWASPSKPGDTRPPLGTAALGAVSRGVALGGVTAARVPDCRAAGAVGVAGMGGLFGAQDVAAAVAAWRAAWGGFRS